MDLRNVDILRKHYTASEDLYLNLHRRENLKPLINNDRYSYIF